VIEIPLSRRIDLVAQRYTASAAGRVPGWQTMRCDCRHRSIFGVSAGWLGRGVAIYLYPRPGFRS
jgi:hypothetical protein